MTDPLSVAAAAITLVGACTECVKRLKNIIRGLRDAPGEILALLNETNDMSIMLTEVNIICQD
jgi:hypothetical protein